MKQNLLLFSMFAALGASAQTVAEPTAAWAEFLIGMPGQDQASAIATDGNNQVYWMATDGTSSADREVTYAGAALYEGAMYDGTGANKNLTLLKTDADGVKQWCAYSTRGDFSANEGGVTVNKDGDVVFATCVRHTDGYFSDPVTIVDGKGNATSLDWTIADRRWDQLIVGTLSSDGEMKWVKTYMIDHSPVPAATGTRADHTADAINCYAVTVDNDNNIYVAGNFRTDLTLPTASGANVVLQPKNVTGWDGDAQATVGSFYLIKLDSDGYYLDHLAEGGADIQASYIQRLAWNNGKIYAYGYLKGKNGASVTVAGKELTPTDYISPLVGCFDTEFNAIWVECLPGDAVAGKNAVQSVGMTVDSDGNLWLAGQYNGKISDPANADKFVASTQGNLREGFIIRLNADNGAWISSVNSRTDFNQAFLTGYTDVIVPASDPMNIYVYGYAMNASVGVFLRCYDKETLVGDPDKSWNILTKGGVPTSQNIAYVPAIGAAYVTARGNQAFQPLGGELTENPGGYTNLLARFNLPEDFTTGIETISSNAISELTLNSGRGYVIITNDSEIDLPATVYDITGRLVSALTVNAGESVTVNLAPGIYIIAEQKLIL